MRLWEEYVASEYLISNLSNDLSGHVAVIAGTTLRLGKLFAQVNDAMDRYGLPPFDGASFALEEETVLSWRWGSRFEVGAFLGAFIIRNPRNDGKYYPVGQHSMVGGPTKASIRGICWFRINRPGPVCIVLAS